MGIIACDLDGTLAHHDQWLGFDHIGKPIPLMVSRVKKAIAEGNEVRIFTARADENGSMDVVIPPIRKWLKEVGLPDDLVITNIKGWDVNEFWDDRAKQVITNTGVFVEDRLKQLEDLID